jgi:hypothetical protein
LDDELIDFPSELVNTLSMRSSFEIPETVNSPSIPSDDPLASSVPSNQLPCNPSSKHFHNVRVKPELYQQVIKDGKSFNDGLQHILSMNTLLQGS